MLQSIKTKDFLTVLPPRGGAPFAIPKQSSIYEQAVGILGSSMAPVETWEALQQLGRNPWEALAAWFGAKGVSFKKNKEENSFLLNDRRVADKFWLPFFQQCMQRKHCASTATLILARMGADYTPSRPCTFVAADDGIKLLVKTQVPAATRIGATVYGAGYMCKA